jgi:hypothetical protein
MVRRLHSTLAMRILPTWLILVASSLNLTSCAEDPSSGSLAVSRAYVGQAVPSGCAPGNDCRPRVDLCSDGTAFRIDDDIVVSGTYELRDQVIDITWSSPGRPVQLTLSFDEQACQDEQGNVWARDAASHCKS